MGSFTSEVILLLLLMVLNGFFSMAEIAILSSRKSRLKHKADAGHPSYHKVLELATHPGPLLSTMQVGITLIGILIGALGEATLSSSLQAELEQIDFLKAYADPISFVVVILGITLASLFVGELVPKRIALSNPEKIAASLVYPVQAFYFVFYP